MSSADAVAFFDKKRPWSKYKDLILDYYLEPYLAKIATLRKPILVVDCFAGAGRFRDGSEGSPLIIIRHLERLAQRGVKVKGIFIEKEEELFTRLSENADAGSVDVSLLKGDFHDHLGAIESASRGHSTFVYVDPLAPKDLCFDDLALVYQELRSGQSVETLVNFMSTAFVRVVCALRDRIEENGAGDDSDATVRKWSQIAGGDYWRSLVQDQTLSQRERIDRVAKGYAESLHKWFRYVLNFPIRESYSDEQPKYHLVFGSRHSDAVELMNDAMVKARRQFVGAEFVDDMLFDNQPREEVVEDRDVLRFVVNTLQRLGRSTWRDLRVEAMIEVPCKYTQSEWSRAIKHGIRHGSIKSDADGKRIENDAITEPA